MEQPNAASTLPDWQILLISSIYGVVSAGFAFALNFYLLKFQFQQAEYKGCELGLGLNDIEPAFTSEEDGISSFSQYIREPALCITLLHFTKSTCINFVDKMQERRVASGGEENIDSGIYHGILFRVVNILVLGGILPYFTTASCFDNAVRHYTILGYQNSSVCCNGIEPCSSENLMSPPPIFSDTDNNSGSIVPISTNNYPAAYSLLNMILFAVSPYVIRSLESAYNAIKYFVSNAAAPRDPNDRPQQPQFVGV